MRKKGKKGSRREVLTMPSYLVNRKECLVSVKARRVRMTRLARVLNMRIEVGRGEIENGNESGV